jgi:hypothetical protein
VELLSFFILPSFKQVSSQLSKTLECVANIWCADDEKPACYYEYDSSLSNLQTLPSQGLSGLLARLGWKSEISVRHTDLVTTTDAIKASLTLEAWKVLLPGNARTGLALTGCMSGISSG